MVIIVGPESLDLVESANGQLARIQLQIRQKLGWISCATVANITLNCRLPSSNCCDRSQELLTKSALFYVFEPLAGSSLLSPGSCESLMYSPIAEANIKNNRPVNCYAFLFLQPSVVLSEISIEQTAKYSVIVKSLTLGCSRTLGGIGFEYYVRDRKWLTTWSSTVSPFSWSSSATKEAGYVNVLQFGLRTFAPMFDVSINIERTELLGLSSLINQFDSTTIQCNETEHISLNDLSPEIICRIVSSIPTEFHMKAIFALSGVSRRLRSVLSHPSFYHSADFKVIGINEAQAAFLKDRATSSLKSLRLSHVPLLAGSQAVSLIRFVAADSLTTFVANGCEVVDDFFLQLLCTRHRSLQEIDVSYCFSLSSVGFSFLSLLKTLRSLSVGSTNVDKDTLITLVRSCPLQSLSLSSLAHSSLSEIDQVCNELGLYAASTLKAIDLSCSDRLTLQGLQNLVTRCHLLEEINLRRCGNRNVFLSCDLSGCGYLLASCCPNLRIVGFPIFVAIQDIRALGNEALRCSLEEVYIDEVSDASASEVQEALRFLSESCRRLSYVTIRRHSSKNDAVDEEFCAHFPTRVTITPLLW